MTYHEERFPDDYELNAEGSVSVIIGGQEYLYYPESGGCVSTNSIDEFSTTVAPGLQGSAITSAIAAITSAKAARLAAKKATYAQEEELKWEVYRKASAEILPHFPLWKSSVNQRCFYLWVDGEKKGYIPFYGEPQKTIESAMSLMEATVASIAKAEALRKAGKPVPKHLR